jgi:hypothetical protein
MLIVKYLHVWDNQAQILPLLLMDLDNFMHTFGIPKYASQQIFQIK